jgi:hypothetical protein
MARDVLGRQAISAAGEAAPAGMRVPVSEIGDASTAALIDLGEAFFLPRPIGLEATRPEAGVGSGSDGGGHDEFVGARFPAEKHAAGFIR